MRNTLFATFIIFCFVLPSHAAEITGWSPSFIRRDIIGDREKPTGNEVHLSLGSSGTFAAQISNGAPFDVLLSADIGSRKIWRRKDSPRRIYFYLGSALVNALRSRRI